MKTFWVHRSHKLPACEIAGSLPLRTMRAGFTLIEILAVIGVMSLIVGMLLLTIAGVVRIERHSAAFHQRMVDRANIGDQFRSDVAQALTAPPKWDRFQASKHCLILEHGKETHIVYEWDGKKLTRFQSEAKKTTSQPMPADDDEVRFYWADPRLCRLRLTAASTVGERIPEEFSAALGGERR